MEYMILLRIRCCWRRCPCCARLSLACDLATILDYESVLHVELKHSPSPQCRRSGVLQEYQSAPDHLFRNSTCGPTRSKASSSNHSAMIVLPYIQSRIISFGHTIFHPLLHPNNPFNPLINHPRNQQIILLQKNKVRIPMHPLGAQIHPRRTDPSLL